MKKFLSISVAVILLATLVLSTTVGAWEKEVGAVFVPYAAGDGIKIDGTMAQGEWSETNKIILNGNNMASWTSTLPENDIAFYYSWGDKGLYMAAIVLDSELGFQTADNGASASTTMFQISFNPAAIIAEGYNVGGLFFSFLLDSADGTEAGANGIVRTMKHNWESAADGQVEIEDEENYAGKYSLTKGSDNKTTGFVMEVLLPWSVIATEDRLSDLDDTDTILLNNFNPNDTNRKRAFCTATICYVNFASVGTITARTCKEGNAGDFDVQSYDCLLYFMNASETAENRGTETEYFTAAPETKAPETAAPETNAPETNAPATNAPETAAPGTNASEGTKAPETKPVEKPTEKDGFPVWGWILIAVGVVAIVVVVIVVVKKKK